MEQASRERHVRDDPFNPPGRLRSTLLKLCNVWLKVSESAWTHKQNTEHERM